MNTRYISYLAWMLTLLALFSFAAVAYFAWTIAGEHASRGTRLSSAQESALRGAAASRAHALIADTEAERRTLDEFFRADVISVASLIRNAGASAGVKTEVSNALPEALPPGAVASGLPLNAIGFVVHTEGSFASLMRALKLFETLPVPVTLGRFDVEQTPSGDSWHMSVYLRVLTSAPLSS